MNNQVKQIDAEKLFSWAERCVVPVRKEDIRRAYELGLFDPDTPPVPTIKPGDRVKHTKTVNVLVADDLKVISLESDDIATVAHEGESFKLPLADLEVVE